MRLSFSCCSTLPESETQSSTAQHSPAEPRAVKRLLLPTTVPFLEHPAAMLHTTESDARNPWSRK